MGGVINDRVAAERQAWDNRMRGQFDELSVLGSVVVDWLPIHDQLLRSIDLDETKRVLDCGCGAGLLSASVAARGANVVAFDVSGESLNVAQAYNAELPVRFILAAFERLPFSPGSFDAAVGMFVLHHVDLPATAEELKRVMVPGSTARFVETWGHNPLLRVARRLTGRWGVAKYGTEDERPLRMADVEVLRQAGLTVRLEYPSLTLFQLVDNNLLRRRWAKATRALQWIDRRLDRFEALKPFGYYAIFHIERPA